MSAVKIVKKTSLKKKSSFELYSNFLVDCEKLYIPIFLAGLEGVEPSTSESVAPRSIQLSYKP